MAHMESRKSHDPFFCPSKSKVPIALTNNFVLKILGNKIKPGKTLAVSFLAFIY